ncbi:MAG TPA: phage tail protein [Vicinamibacterales bacterium]|nr:phage tail protein [Vicinamibacterales bacterium]
MASSSYLQHLPEIFRTPDTPGTDPFLGRFLLIFEALLSGGVTVPAPGPQVQGLEVALDAYTKELDPAFTSVTVSGTGSAARFDSPFLTYLATWVALILDQNWDMDRKRRWLERIVPLYQRRGTRAGLAEYLTMFVGNQARIDEPLGGFVLGKVNNVKQTSTLAVDTFLAGAPAYFFRVRINYGFPEGIADAAGIPAEDFDIAVWRNLRKGTRAIIDLEKPAHTYYTLDARTPGIILGFKNATVVGGKVIKGRATVARDTLIWQRSKPF